MKYKVEYTGKNFLNFTEFLNRNKISISNICESEENKVLFNISVGEYKKLVKLNKVFKLNVVSVGGIKKFFRELLSRVGIVIGIVSIIVVSIFSSKIVMGVKVVGNSKITDNEIKNAIENYGVKFGNPFNCNVIDLERYLLNNVQNLNLVSVSKQGNLLVINVVENAKSNNLNTPFYSPYNMVIKIVKLISGTLCVKENDVVKKGDLLVDNYVIGATGERLEVEANAEIVAEAYFCGSETVNKVSKYYVKTGEKIVKKSLSFLKPKKHDIVTNFLYFDTNYTYNILSHNNLLPIYVNTTSVFELQEVEEIFDYENNKDIYFEKSLKNAYALVPINVTINNTIQKVAETEDKYIFQTYLKSDVRLNNEN